MCQLLLSVGASNFWAFSATQFAGFSSLLLKPSSNFAGRTF